MKLVFAELAWEDYLYWQKQDRKMVERINKLIEATARDPFPGIGKPEPLKDCDGCWSRRIDDVNRLVYRLSDDEIEIIQCKGHYTD